MTHFACNHIVVIYRHNINRNRMSTELHCHLCGGPKSVYNLGSMAGFWWFVVRGKADSGISAGGMAGGIGKSSQINGIFLSTNRTLLIAIYILFYSGQRFATESDRFAGS